MWPSLEAKMLHTIVGDDESATRAELSAGQIIDERDYVSAFCTRFRNSCALNNLTAHSQNLPNSFSQAIGADFVIIVHDGSDAKIAILEAKWPRAFIKPNAKWDKSQGGKSHFSSQLIRQKLAPVGAFVGEFFINESTVGTQTSLLDNRGGTIVPHSSAHKYDALRQNPSAPWKTHDFWELHGYKRKKITNLRDLVFGLTTCSIGSRFPISGGNLALTSLDGKCLSSIKLSSAQDESGSNHLRHSDGGQLLIVKVAHVG